MAESATNTGNIVGKIDQHVGDNESPVGYKYQYVNTEKNKKLGIITSDNVNHILYNLLWDIVSHQVDNETAKGEMKEIDWILKRYPKDSDRSDDTGVSNDTINKYLKKAKDIIKGMKNDVTEEVYIEEGRITKHPQTSLAKKLNEESSDYSEVVNKIGLDIRYNYTDNAVEVVTGDTVNFSFPASVEDWENHKEDLLKWTVLKVEAAIDREIEDDDSDLDEGFKDRMETRVGSAKSLIDNAKEPKYVRKALGKDNKRLLKQAITGKREAYEENEVDESRVEPSAVKDLDIDSIKPTQKDIDRAEGLEFSKGTFHGNGTPFGSEAHKMANLIKDPEKLVRRAKAVVAKWGADEGYMSNTGYYHRVEPKKETDVWGPFRDRLKEMGFTNEQIDKIRKYKPSANEEVGDTNEDLNNMKVKKFTVKKIHDMKGDHWQVLDSNGVLVATYESEIAAKNAAMGKKLNEEYDPFTDMKKVEDTEWRSGLYTDGKGSFYERPMSGTSKWIKNKNLKYRYNFETRELEIADNHGDIIYNVGLGLGNWLDGPEYWFNQACDDMEAEENEFLDNYKKVSEENQLSEASEEKSFDTAADLEDYLSGKKSVIILYNDKKYHILDEEVGYGVK